MTENYPIPANEFERVLDLAGLDFDYINSDGSFNDLTKLAARVAGTEVSLLNLIDSFTQWTIGNHGLENSQLAREESVCQYTIMENDHLEVKNLSLDARFKDRLYVKGDPNLRFYFGVPLKTKKGNNLGSLCVLDKTDKTLSPEKMELLKIIADEIVNRLMAFQVINSLKQNLNEATEVKKRVAHDIRGPIGGIIGLAQYISEKGEKNKLDEVLDFIKLIQKSGISLLELTDEILNEEFKAAVEVKLELKEHELNLLLFKDKLEKLYMLQAKNKGIQFVVETNPENDVVPFPKNKLLQITGNLISNAMKFTPSAGKVGVHLNLVIEEVKTLHIKVTDTGIGLSEHSIEQIQNGASSSTDGTKGEQGYGFGLPLVKYLIESLKGKLHIESELGKGTTFYIKLPIQ